ncbi:MAG TPA: hypothetical protein QF549_00600 [Candidatus Saccharimonadaceae bacterium]|nr:hypothetical protein [Candidatus Saccharimonadaceae bacterium]
MENAPRTSKFDEFLYKRPYASDALLILAIIAIVLLAAALGWLVGSWLGAARASDAAASCRCRRFRRHRVHPDAHAGQLRVERQRAAHLSRDMRGHFNFYTRNLLIYY